MKRLFGILFLLSLTVACYSQVGLKLGGEKGVSSLGLIGGYAVANKATLAGLDFRYNIADRVRFAPSVLYIIRSNNPSLMYALKSDNKSTWYVNTDLHYLIRLTPRFSVFPLCGIGMSIWNFDDKNLIIKDENGQQIEGVGRDTKVRVGLNLGYGCEGRVTDELLIGAEFKYNLTIERVYDQALLTVRLAYYF